MTHLDLDDRSSQKLRRFFDDPIDLDQPPELLGERTIAAMLDDGGSSTAADTSAATPVVEIDSRRWRRGTPWLLAAACVVVVLAGVGLVAADPSSSPSDESLELASAELAALEGVGAATASLIDDGGTTRLNLSMTGMDAPAGEYLELWLLGGPDDDPVSLGDASAGQFDVSDAVDLEQYSVVDVSVEAYDGDQSHSGRSVFRGSLGSA